MENVVTSAYAENVVDSLVKVARPIILESFSADSCIASTRIAIDVLDYFGIKAEPLPLIATLFNVEAIRIASQDGIETLAEIQAGRSPEDEGGPWSLAVGARHPDQAVDVSRWVGHLVAAIPDQRLIIDLSIDQANRPAKNMHFESYSLVIEQDGWWDRTTPAVEFTTDDGCSVILDRNVQDADGFLRSPNWTISARHRRAFKTATGRIIRAVREDLATTDVRAGTP